MAIDRGVKAAEMCLCVAVCVGTGAKALTVVVVDKVVAATNPKADQMAVLVNFIV